MKQYKSYNDIERDLKRLELERQIAWETMALQKNKISDELKPTQWIITAYRMAQRYGVFMLVRRFFK